MGISCEPRRNSISALVTLEKATGVFSPARDASTSKPDIFRTAADKEKFTTAVPVPTVTDSLEDL